MLGPTMSHQEYESFVKKMLKRHYTFRKIPILHEHIWQLLFLVDLSFILPILKGSYSEIGCKSNDPQAMLRSLIAMTLCGVTAIEKWVANMRSFPYYAIISGFDPDDVPGIGTFYDFMDRLFTETKRSKLRKKRRRPKGKKPKHPQIVEGLVKRILRKDNLYFKPTKPEDIINEIFHQGFVKKSASLGLIDLEKLYVCGDGSKLETSSNHLGKKVCNCKEKCDCKRLISDLDARWGWDSYRKCWVYGYGIHQFVAFDPESKVELPITIQLTGANRHDSPMGVSLLREAFLRGYSINLSVFDSAYDAYYFYFLCYTFGIIPIIPLNETNKGNFSYPPPIEVNEDAIPICLNNLTMTYWGFCKDRCRLKFRCPLVALKKTPHLSTCPFSKLCSPSNYGRVVYTKPMWDLRIFTPIPRKSKQWKSFYKKRTSVERSYKSHKYDCNLQTAGVRGRKRWFWRVILAAMCKHIKVWFTHSLKKAA